MKDWQKEIYKNYLFEKYHYPEMSFKELSARDQELEAAHRRLLRAILGYDNTREMSVKDMKGIMRKS